LAQVKAGKVRALAVSSARRWPAVPELPTIAESGLPGFEAASWFGMLAPAGTPPAVINKIQADIAAALSTADSKKYFEGSGYAGIANKPEEFGELIRSDMAKWEKVIRTIEARKR